MSAIAITATDRREAAAKFMTDALDALGKAEDLLTSDTDARTVAYVADIRNARRCLAGLPVR